MGNDEKGEQQCQLRPGSDRLGSHAETFCVRAPGVAAGDDADRNRDSGGDDDQRHRLPCDDRPSLSAHQSQCTQRGEVAAGVRALPWR